MVPACGAAAVLWLRPGVTDETGGEFRISPGDPPGYK